MVKLFGREVSFCMLVLLVCAQAAWAETSAPSAEEAQQDITDNLFSGRVFPAFYFGRSHSLTGALAYLIQKQQDNSPTPYIQFEGGSRVLTIRGGVSAYSAVGAGYAVGIAALRMQADKSDEIFHQEGNYAGIDVSVMFGLAVVRLGYYKPLDEEKKTAPDAVNLSIGIGLF